MILQHFLIDYNEVNSYIVGCEKSREAMLIDAGKFDPRVTRFVGEIGYQLKIIYLTHGHWDHTDALEEYKQAFPAAVSMGMETGFYPPGYDLALLPGDELRIGEIAGPLYQTTGHTDDSLTWHLPQYKMMFVGDAIFAGSIGGTKSDELKQDLIGKIEKHILSAPGDTELFSGHGPATIVEIEKRYNPILNA